MHRIERWGKISFAEVMRLALYHPLGGYYTRSSAVGASGDYFTSPAAHPAFGALFAVQLHRMWELLERPERFVVVEMGAGSRLLARAALDYAGRMGQDFAQSLRYVALERYADPAQGADRAISMQPVVTDSVPLKGVVGCLVSNELVDSFPVHRFQIDHGSVKEVYLTEDGRGGLTEVLDQPSTPLLAQRLAQLGRELPDGFQGEVNLDIAPWMREVSDALERGFVVTIDYGFEADELYSSKRAHGTLQTYYRHTQGGSPYQRVGKQDITAHVDFSFIASEGSSLGLVPLGLRTQSQFLKTLGFDLMLEALRAKELDQRRRNGNMMALLELVKAEGLGGFKVLIQERGTGVDDLGQLTPQAPPEIEVPLLRLEHVPLMEGRYPHLAWDMEELWPANESTQVHSEP
jgi:SAM-dependent MidA family methyltransferase